MKSFVLIFFVSITNFSFSQNLLVNGGFEDENICTEFHINCAPEGWISTADTYNNFFKIPGLAHHGQHCVAIEAGQSRKQFMRTYIRSQLLCRLRGGSKYKIEFYARSRHNILDSVGVYFTSYDFLFEKQVRYKIIPSLYLADAMVHPAKGDTNWQKISIEYTATGKEMYLTLGNFSKRDITGSTGIPLQNNFFVFFDDVSLTAEDPHEKICDGWEKIREEIYSFDSRHQFLDLYVKTYARKPAALPQTTKTILQTIDTLVLPDIFFQVDESELSRKGFWLLDSLCNALSGKRIDSLVIEGHTDNTGKRAHNEQLSQDRAMSVADYVGQKILSGRQLITTRGWGSKKPVADNRTIAGRQLNRRVEVFIYLRQ